jgi:preprotein translocase subunit SecD
MKIRFFRFNTYLLGTDGAWLGSWAMVKPTLLLLLLLTFVAGCSSTDKKEKKEKGYSKRDQASLRLYLEVNPDGSDRSGAISVGRQSPFTLNVEKKAFLTEFNVEKASVVESFGGFSISVRFDKEGSWILEQYSTANKGKRIAIAAEFGTLRWLAAPVIQQRIADGMVVFTPDASREEADRIVSGLNRVAELVKSGRM